MPVANDRTAAQIERVLAVGRACLTVTALGAIYLDPTEPARFAALTYAVLVAYALYSLVVLALVHRAARVSRRHVYVLHLFDILWASGLTFISQGPVSPFFLFFLFAVLAGAYRWGFWETAATACLTVVVFLIETAIATAGPWRGTWFSSIPFELNATIFRVAYLLLTGFLLGYFAEQEKKSRSEVAAMADAARQLRFDLGLDGAVRTVAQELIGIFGAARADCVVQELQSEGASLWQVSADAAASQVDRIDLTPDQQRQWLFPDPGPAWHAERRSGGDDWTTRATTPASWPVVWKSIRVPDAIATDARTVTAVNIGRPDDWRGRIYLVNASRVRGVERTLHFLEALSEYITPGLTNVLLLRRLRSQVTAAERARVARELHDGAIQGLYGLRLRVQAIRRRTDRDSSEYDGELGEVQELLQREALTLRELMHALRPIELDSSGQLPDVLASVVERFRRDTGLTARFVSSGAPFVLHPDTALELVRIVQEALANVRKHSHARNVLVRLAREERVCTLVIEDDGVGFTFEGRLCANDLDRQRLGPTVIKERARIAGARLAVDSTPGSGARIELSFADATHA